MKIYSHDILDNNTISSIKNSLVKMNKESDRFKVFIKLFKNLNLDYNEIFFRGYDLKNGIVIYNFSLGIEKYDNDQFNGFLNGCIKALNNKSNTDYALLISQDDIRLYGRLELIEYLKTKILQ